jgi:hypothetical protein
MARFILDVDTTDIKRVLEVIDRDLFLSDNTSTITCVDKTNDAQFYFDDPTTGCSYSMNALTKKQVQNYKDILKNQSI